jgi:hypothetical protein
MADGKTGVDKINEEAKFALTWNGFALNSSNKEDNTSRVRISDSDDFQILNKDNEELVKIGRLQGQNSVGIQISVNDGSNSVIMGDTGFVDEEHGKLVFRAGKT